MSDKKRKRPVRNFFMGLIVAIAVFLAALLGNVFPGLNDFRDRLIENQAYSETVESQTTVEMPTGVSEILIEEDSIYYMGEEVSIEELSDALGNVDSEFVTITDHYATQRTWDTVYQLVESSGFAINEDIAR